MPARIRPWREAARKGRRSDWKKKPGFDPCLAYTTECRQQWLTARKKKITFPFKEIHGPKMTIFQIDLFQRFPRRRRKNTIHSPLSGGVGLISQVQMSNKESREGGRKERTKKERDGTRIDARDKENERKIFSSLKTSPSPAWKLTPDDPGIHPFLT